MATETVLKDKSVWESEELLTGTDAVAQAVRLADVDVFAAYPIRPYTGVMDRLAKFIADGKFDSEYIIADGVKSQSTLHLWGQGLLRGAAERVGSLQLRLWRQLRRTGFPFSHWLEIGRSMIPEPSE